MEDDVFTCTPLVLPAGSLVAREPTRPPQFRDGAFSAEFDEATLFYDVIATSSHGAPSLVLVGPPLLNLIELILGGRIDGRALRPQISGHYTRDRCCDIWISGRSGHPLEFAFEFCAYHITPMPARHDAYRGRRVLYTLSKDNCVRWIIDWVRYYVANHGADALLLYDNASTEYTSTELEGVLRSLFPGLVVNVVDWPYKYGPAGISRTAWWDSDYCQAGAFQDARFRFLELASSVLNCDVDELVVSPSGESIFEAAERCATGYVAFHGRWISTALASVRQGVGAGSRHGHFRYLEPPGPHPCPTKWCVVPSRCAIEDEWSTHRVRGVRFTSAISENFAYCHFRGISTNWKYPRSEPKALEHCIHRLDEHLVRCLARAGM
jgi:Glycosyltransferase family 92